jgi:hypothetical protein
LPPPMATVGIRIAATAAVDPMTLTILVMIEPP